MKTIKLILCFLVFISINITAQTTLVVTKTTDPDPYQYPYNFNDSLCNPEMYGTLQWAVRKANDIQTNVNIVFNIQGAGTHTINLEYTLPVLKAHVSVDGSSQTGYTQGNPSVIINGQNNIFIGINLHNLSSNQFSILIILLNRLQLEYRVRVIVIYMEIILEQI